MSKIKPDQIIVFTDGACTGNPGPGGWGVIIALPEGQIKELGGGERETTNNKMELTATIKALAHLKDRPETIAICTDSVYVIRGITQWIFGWMRRGWLNAEGGAIANQDLWKKLFFLVRERQQGSIDWHFVRGHVGTPGNERADEIAVAFAKSKRIDLYDGPLLRYDVAIYDIPENTDVPEMKDKSKLEKKKAFSYLSVIGGKPMRHATWPECERRVKGQPGARFKKAMSPSDEQEILAAWGFSTADL